jgi:hypothetical protein
MNTKEKLIEYRNKLYQLFLKRKDAIFELMDANTASNKTCPTVVQLSKCEFFTRQYSSITDALTDGLASAQWPDIQKLLWEFTQPKEQVGYPRFVIDCTPNDRLHARTLEDRSIVHKANPAPGNKPICAGHEYSSVVYLPTGSSEDRKRWVVPLATQRVHSTQKGPAVGMMQLSETLRDLGLEDVLTVSIADSAYATEACRQQSAALKEHIHITRLRNNRNVYELLSVEAKTKGRKKVFGRKMCLNNPSSFLNHDEELNILTKSKSGSPLSLQIKGWNTVSFRGSKQFKAQQHPFRLIQVIALNEHKKPVFKKPLWLAIFGNKRLTLSLQECVDNYRDRYDIEHYFRFGKQNLRMDSFQTFDTAHEEHWWKLCALCYCQLYLSNELTQAIPEPWERHLPEFKNENSYLLTSAAFTQRGFSKLLRVIGTPARNPIQRGNPLGRAVGQRQVSRVEKLINFKKNVAKSKPKKDSFTFENQTGKSKPQNIDDIVQMVNSMLIKIGISLETFFIRAQQTN